MNEDAYEAMPEKRRKTRWRIALTALLYHHGLPIIRGHTRDISAAGALVHTGPAGLAPGTRLDLELVLPVGTGIEPHRVRARVRRLARQGLGLSFEDLDGDLQARLRGLVTDPETGSHRPHD